MTAPNSRTESITEHLRNEILRGEYRPGDKLPAERDLAGRLDVARASVREALRTLEQLGLVDVRRGGGATVRELEDASVEIVPFLLFADGKLDAEIAVQLLDVHEMLVSGAARLSVERGSDDELQRARELLRRLRRGGADPDERATVVDALLELMTRASGNLVLRLCQRAVGPDWMRRIGGVLWGPLRPSDDVLDRQFSAVDVAIERRDPAATEEAVRDLLRDRRNRLLTALEDPAIARQLGAAAAPND